MNDTPFNTPPADQSARKRIFKSAAEKAGLPPGALVHVGKEHELGCKISVTQYSKDTLIQREICSITELEQFKNDQLITWLNVDGLSDIDTIESIGQFLISCYQRYRNRLRSGI